MSAKKPFLFKSSALSSAADQLWTASKKEFKAGDSSIKLDLGKTLAEKAKSNPRPSEVSKSSGFVFGSKITERDGDKLQAGNGVISEASKESDQPKTASAVFESILKKVPTSIIPSGSGDGATSGEKSQAGNYSTTGGSKESDQGKTASSGFESILKKNPCSSTQSTFGDGSSMNDGASTSVKLKDSISQSDSLDKTIASQSKTTNVVISTGEENEINVHHASCKIYAFEPSQKKYVERGLANLRINRCDDSEISTEHRIVGRVSGNQRVIINSRIFPNMLLEKVSAKRLKFSAQTPDSDLPQIFLAMGSEFVIEQLYMVFCAIVNMAKEDAVSRKRKASNSDSSNEKTPPKKTAADPDS